MSLNTWPRRQTPCLCRSRTVTEGRRFACRSDRHILLTGPIHGLAPSLDSPAVVEHLRSLQLSKKTEFAVLFSLLAPLAEYEARSTEDWVALPAPYGVPRGQSSVFTEVRVLRIRTEQPRHLIRALRMVGWLISWLFYFAVYPIHK